MTIKYLRRDKTGSSSIETRLYGPVNDKAPPDDTDAQQVAFVDAKITEIADDGTVSTVIRSVAQINVVTGQHYLLGWTMWGDKDAAVEYLLGSSADPAGVTFTSVAKDKIPAAGPGLTASKATPSGKLIWINSKLIAG